MVDHQTVCCMCGDVGFPDKLFNCSKCHYRSQHSYCSNYYNESPELIEICDWCRREGKNVKRSATNSKKLATQENTDHQSELSGGKYVKDHDREEGSEKGKNPVTGAPSPRRRYKLLKDVMC